MNGEVQAGGKCWRCKAKRAYMERQKLAGKDAINGNDGVFLLVGFDKPRSIVLMLSFLAVRLPSAR